MPDFANAARWEHCGASVCGVAHVRTGLPNQDALEFWQPHGNGGSTVIMAVADGHGSAPHVRSAIGAQLGVEAAVDVLREFSRDPQMVATLSNSKTQVAQSLPTSLVNAWSRAVTRHLENNPFGESDWGHLAGTVAETVRKAVNQDQLLAYGSTLLAVLVTDGLVLFLQIGDGDILCVNEQGETSRPLPADPRLVANRTTSLCQANAAENFRIRILGPQDRLPALIILSTDGYANAFRTDHDYLMIGSDYLTAFAADGREGVASQLENILAEASEKGSGDDITLGLLRRVTGDENSSGQSRVPLASVDTHAERPEEAHDTSANNAHPDRALLPLRKRVAWLSAAVVQTALVAIGSLALSLFILRGQIKREHPLAKQPVSETVGPKEAPVVSEAATVPPLTLRINSRVVIALHEGTIITAKQLGLDPQAVGEEVARVELAGGRQQLALVNNSKTHWTVISQQKQVSISPESIAPLANGMLIYFDSRHCAAVESANAVQRGEQE